MISATDLVSAVGELKDKGYTHEFRIKNKQLYSDELNKGYGMKSFAIDDAYAFSVEGDGNGENQERLFAITLTDADENIKGFLVDVYGAIDTVEATEVCEKFDANNAHIHHLSDAETKYGLPRVRKAEFNAAPERYVFRMGFPDFPACPFGNKFEALGWDRQDKKYVWFTSSIIKDDRLKGEHYKN